MKQLGIIIYFVLAANLTAFADGTPLLEIQSGSASVDVTLASEGDGIWGITSPASYTLGNGASFTLSSVILDADPSVHYAIGVTNDDSSADSSFTPYTFTFTTPTTLSPAQYSVSASLAGSLTDGGEDGVTLEPTSSGPVQQSFIGANDAGVDLINMPIHVDSSPYSQPFGPFTAASTYNLTSTVSQISVTTSFNLSGNDSASLSGRFDVSAVPEPSSLPLAFVAVGAFAALVVCARRSRGELRS